MNHRRGAIAAVLAVALVTVLATLAPPAMAVLTIDITKGIDDSIPIAVVPFALEGVGDGDANQPADVIAADLERSGKFAPLPRADFLNQPHDADSVRYKNWRLLDAEALVVGRVLNLGNGELEVRFRLLDVFREQQLAGQKLVVPVGELRRAAHQISDIIHATLLGGRGVHNTRIAMVSVSGVADGRRYLLQVADTDGHGADTILESMRPILSPAWSPDGNQLAYVSFENNRSMIYVQDIWSGERRRVAAHVGLNSAPAWSPDGSQLAMTLSRTGNPEIYVLTLADDDLRRLTRHTAIDTEPTWSPDGATIAFTSNRAGTPQIYLIDTAGGSARRITFAGRYNAAASYAPDGESLALITNQGNGYRVGLYSVAERSVLELTDTVHDESPSFAPNGAMILYATQLDGRGVLAAVSPDGRVRRTIHAGARDPAWSPYNVRR